MISLLQSIFVAVLSLPCAFSKRRNHPSYWRSLVGAEDDLEVHLAVVADGVCGAAVLDLVGVGPALGQVAVVGRALLLGALGLGRVDGEADVVVAAFHDGDVVGSAVEAVVFAVAELEEGLG